jgi:chloramphenicol 3-O phosphotransferase
VSGRVLALNGTTSAGKTTLAAALQHRLPDVWFVWGVDTFLSTTSFKLYRSDGIVIAGDGTITLGPEFDRLYSAFRRAVGAFVEGGADIILDEVLLSGAEARAAWDEVLARIDVRWVRVDCDLDVTEAREVARGDRVVGQARWQAARVHVGMTYDAVVDTTELSPEQAADEVVRQLQLG